MSKMDSDLEKRISRIEDESAIKKTVYNYCFKQDQRNVDGFLDLLTDDIFFTFRGWALELKGKEELKNYFLEQVFGTHEYHMHQATNLTIELDGDTADCEAYLALSSSSDGASQEAGIRYMIKTRKENGTWKLSEIHCEVVTWKGTFAPEDESVYERFTV
ncbi:MAG: nuclear transport factor 2 family protein [Nitrospina sp.]|jgi:ketosteroid isomerase-like protein|nr:nuclear transport factor 2 family protein [Nitrospina sp.]